MWIEAKWPCDQEDRFFPQRTPVEEAFREQKCCLMLKRKEWDGVVYQVNNLNSTWDLKNEFKFWKNKVYY